VNDFTYSDEYDFLFYVQTQVENSCVGTKILTHLVVRMLT